jgi:uncharacterized membrane protein
MYRMLRNGWQEMRSSFWFLPAVLVIGAVGFAIALITLDVTVDLDMGSRWPLLFGAGAAGARGLLMTVASSMITVAAMVFSITIVALALTSSQYSSRVVRNFMRDRMNQLVLGVFVSTFAYCLVVLRTIRGGDEGAFVPSLAVVGALLLAFVGIAFLIFFIHHISIRIQASSIIAEAAHETIAAVDHAFPEESGDADDEGAYESAATSFAEQEWTALPAQRTGYIQSFDGDALLAFARKHGLIVRMERSIGEFVVEGAALVSMNGASTVDEETATELNAVYEIGRHRTVQQDPGYGIRQIVDVALKALSQGINDSTTAVMCVDYLSAILARLATRRITTPNHMDEGTIRVIADGPTFESLLAEAFDQIRQSASGNVAVLTRQLHALETIARRTISERRRQSLRQHAELIRAVAECTITSSHDREAVIGCSARLLQILGGHR